MINYTKEQINVINANERVILVDSVSGSGKSTTAVGFAKARPHKKILYVVYNASMKKEAEKDFKECKNVTILTMHGLAYRAIGYKYKDVLSFSYKEIDVIKNLKLRADNYELAKEILDAWTQFLTSECVDIETVSKFIDNQNVVEYIEKLFYLKSNGMIPVEHDFYLKLYAMSMPDLGKDYDIMIADEIQDVSRDFASIMLLNILHSSIEQFLMLGDTRQNIYMWRGTVNAFEYFKDYGHKYRLTISQRVGNEVAEMCNAIFGGDVNMSGVNKNQTIEEINLGDDDDIDTEFLDKKMAIICRNNASIFRIAIDCYIKGLSMYFVGGVDGYRLQKYLNYYYFMRGCKSKDLFLSKFNSWKELCRYAEEVEDAEVICTINIVRKYGVQIPQLVAQITQTCKKKESDADVVLTTCHKSKGMTINNRTVYVHGDLAKDSMDDMTDEDKNLLYVGLTRMKNGKLIINSNIKSII